MAKYAYFQGKFVPIEDAKISIMTHAFNYGTGVFEGIRAYWNEDDKQLYVFRMLEHYERFILNGGVPSQMTIRKERSIPQLSMQHWLLERLC